MHPPIYLIVAALLAAPCAVALTNLPEASETQGMHARDWSAFMGPLNERQLFEQKALNAPAKAPRNKMERALLAPPEQTAGLDGYANEEAARSSGLGYALGVVAAGTCLRPGELSCASTVAQLPPDMRLPETAILVTIAGRQSIALREPPMDVPLQNCPKISECAQILKQALAETHAQSELAAKAGAPYPEQPAARAVGEKAGQRLTRQAEAALVRADEPAAQSPNAIAKQIISAASGMGRGYATTEPSADSASGPSGSFQGASKAKPGAIGVEGTFTTLEADVKASANTGALQELSKSADP